LRIGLIALFINQTIFKKN